MQIIIMLLIFVVLFADCAATEEAEEPPDAASSKKEPRSDRRGLFGTITGVDRFVLRIAESRRSRSPKSPLQKQTKFRPSFPYPLSSHDKVHHLEIDFHLRHPSGQLFAHFSIRGQGIGRICRARAPPPIPPNTPIMSLSAPPQVSEPV